MTCSQVAATFAADKPPGVVLNKDYSWTQTIRVTSQEGEVLTCHLPSILLGDDTQHVKGGRLTVPLQRIPLWRHACII